MQERGWGGRAACDAVPDRPPTYGLGIAFLTPSGAREQACPKSVALDLDALSILVEATRALAAQAPSPRGRATCLHRMTTPSGAEILATFVARDGAIRTFYPNTAPRCPDRMPLHTCFCDG